MLIMILWRN